MRIVHNLFNLICIHFTWNQRRAVRFWRCTHTQTREIWGIFLATLSKGHFNEWKKKVQGQVTKPQMPFSYKRKSTNFWSAHVRICVKDGTPLGTQARKLSSSLVHNMFSYIIYKLSSWSMTLANGIVDMSNLVPRVLERLLLVLFSLRARAFLPLCFRHTQLDQQKL